MKLSEEIDIAPETADGRIESLMEIKEEIAELVDRARMLVEGAGHGHSARAEAYWIPHILSALKGDFSMCSMQDTIDEIQESEQDMDDYCSNNPDCDGDCDNCPGME